MPEENIPLVLVVDDHVDIRESVASVLRATIRPVAILFAPTGTDALALLKSSWVDVVVTDFSMPRMGGMELLRHVRDKAPRVPRIMISAYPEDEVFADPDSRELVHDFFRKPVDIDRFIATVAGYIRSRTKERDEFLQLIGGRASSPSAYAGKRAL